MKKLLMTLVLLPLMAAAGDDYTWETQSNGDGTVTICGVIGAKPTGVLTIPATCDGKTVTKVGVRGYSHEDGSFANMGITGLVIPEGVTELSDGAFHGCTKLKSVTLPSTLKVIRNNCFEDCSTLKSIVLPEGLQRVEFDFLNRTAVSTLNLPSTLVDIEEGALAIPSGRKFTVAAGNPRYRIENGYVYDYVNRVVFMRADYYQKTFVIPDGAVCIAECCFGDCDGGNITIPASVRRIDYGAFCECQGLTVTFLGEEPQVNKEDGGIFDGSTNVKVYVQPGQGWEDAVMRGAWQGCPIQYIGSPVTPSIESSYGPFVPGEKVSLAIPALIGYAAKGLPSGLKLDKKTGEITGAAKNPTGEAGVTVTFTKKDASTLTAQFVVGPIPTISVTLEGDSEKCKVTGANKAYLVGKKVSLQAKGPKGTAFVGWFRDGEPWPSEEEFLEPKIKYEMMAEDLDLVARFKAEEVSVVCDTSAGCVVKENVSFPVIVDCESGLKSVSAKKLPSGLKYNKKTGCIEGAAKKAGSYEFSLTVTTEAGSKVTQSFALAVREAEVPVTWWAGTYSGVAINWCDVCDEPPDCGPWELNMEVSISADDTVTGKLWDDGPDYGILKNGRKVTENGETSNWTVELWWYEDGRCEAPSISTMTISSNGVLEYYDNDDANPDDHCPVQATLTRKK